jgi:hypothetical protein
VLLQPEADISLFVYSCITSRGMREEEETKTVYIPGDNLMKCKSIARLTILPLLLGWLPAFADGILGENPEERAQLAPPDSTPSTSLLRDNPNLDYKIRIVYLIPSNRQAHPEAEKILQTYMLRMQAWFRDHMERLGYGRKSFVFETEPDGIVPKVNIAHVAQPDTDFHDFNYGARWGKILTGISTAGFPPFRNGEILLVIAETQVQLQDGSFLQSSVFFGGAGTFHSGVGMVTGETLARMPASFLVDDRPYDGLIIPTIGPYPLVANITFPFFEGGTVSSTSSSAQGGAAHELGHGFALPHDLRNDSNFNGNLMGNGLRGLRGTFFPKRYPNDDVRLSSASALHLNSTRFFNASERYFDDIPPFVEITSLGTVVPRNGLIEISFSASDNESSLAGAVLLRNGSAVADRPLEGNNVRTTISAYDYQPGVSDQWEVMVYDAQGNRAISSPATLTVATGFNRAPIPFIRLSKTNVTVGEQVTLDARRSLDPDGPDSAMRVEWDLDGDGIFDTAPSTVQVRMTSFASPGVYQVAARLTDDFGERSNSMHIGVRVEPPVLNNLVTFEPSVSANPFSEDATNCPSGYSGKFSFDAMLTNTSTQSLSGLRIGIDKLTEGNLLLVKDMLLRERQLFDVPAQGNYRDTKLTTGEMVTIPLTVCLEERKPFKLIVNVHGTTPNS